MLRQHNKLIALRLGALVADVYPHHLVAYGYNGVNMVGVANCWARSVSGAGAVLLPTRVVGEALPHPTSSHHAHLAAMLCLQLLQLKFVNADVGILLSSTDFMTVAGIQADVTAPRWTADTYPSNGHHALWVGRSSEALFTQ